MIPYSRQTITADDIAAVIKTLKSDWLTQGPAVKAFEESLAKYVGAKYCVAFSSGTAALQAAYFAAHIGTGDEIITSPLTFAATSNAALWQGATVVFADVDEHGNLDPKSAESRITPKTKAIVAVDYAGRPADVNKLKALARKRNLVFIEDGAHSLGAEYNDKKVGGIADMTMFSFHPVKSITTGEGGAIVTNSKEYYEKLALFRSHGMTKDQKQYKHPSPGDWYHEMHELGLNYRITDIQAALGVTQLKKLPKFIKKRAEIVERYNKLLAGIPELTLPKIQKDRTSAWHLYSLRVPAHRRAEIFRKLREAGIGVQVHYIPVYWHPYYEKLGYKKGLCPAAEKFYLQEISLPVYPTLSLKDQRFVVETIKKLF